MEVFACESPRCGGVSVLSAVRSLLRERCGCQEVSAGSVRVRVVACTDSRRTVLQCVQCIHTTHMQSSQQRNTVYVIIDARQGRRQGS